MAIVRIDTILSASYLDHLESLPMEEVRMKREECQEAADTLSYLRRLVQGRLDIVQADLERRAGGGPGCLHDLVEQLKRGEILAEGTRARGYGRLATTLNPADTDGWIARELDSIVDAARLSSLPGLSDEEVRAIAAVLAELERRVSDQRAALHERVDALSVEMVRRYRTGEATVDSLLT